MQSRWFVVLALLLFATPALGQDILAQGQDDPIGTAFMRDHGPSDAAQHKQDEKRRKALDLGLKDPINIWAPYEFIISWGVRDLGDPEWSNDSPKHPSYYIGAAIKWRFR